MATHMRAKILALIELAVGETTPEHEAKAAAMAACKKLKETGLLSSASPIGGSSGRRDRKRRTHQSDEVVLTMPFIILTQSPFVLRVGRIEKQQTAQVLLIPKEYVIEVEMMEVEETKAIGWGQSSSIIKKLVLKRSYFDHARETGWASWR